MGEKELSEEKKEICPLCGGTGVATGYNDHPDLLPCDCIDPPCDCFGIERHEDWCARHGRH